MTPAPLPPSARPAAPAQDATAHALPPRGRVGLRLAVLGLLLGLGAMLLAAGTALMLAPGLGATAGPWAAALAAVAGVAVACLPLGWLVFKLAAEAQSGSGRSEAGPALPAGIPLALFMTLAEREFGRARRYGTGAALVLVEVDHYRRLCETRGAPAGAAVLAALLRDTAPTLRTADVLTHFGQAQMAVFLAHADATGALDVAERMRERSEQREMLFPDTPQGLRLRITASAGVAHLRPAHLNLQALIDDAQDALAAARAAGGNCVRAAPVDRGTGGAPSRWNERRAPPRPTRPAPPRRSGGA